MDDKLVSIAMCTYNGEAFLKEQIDSILKQTYKNFELIISDDNSNDSTIDIIKNYQNSDDRIKLYQNQQNLGFLKNFEKVISLCSGEYIALADQDDVWKEYKLEIFLKKINEHVLIYSDAILIDKDSNEIGHELVRPDGYLCNGKCNKSLLLNNFVSGNTLMFKKELLDYILPIPNKMTYHDSWIAFVASTYGSIEYTEEAMTYYRRYSEQVTNREKKKYKNFFEKLKFKKESQIKTVNIRLGELEELRSLKILNDSETIYILDNLINQYKNYANIYFNIKLYRILKKYQDEVFATLTENKRSKRAFRVAIGLKLRTATFFAL